MSTLPDDILVDVASKLWHDNIPLSFTSRYYVQRKRLLDLQTHYPGTLECNTSSFSLIVKRPEILEFLITLPLSQQCAEMVARCSAQVGNFDIVKQLENKISIDKISWHAAYGGYLDIVEWASNKGDDDFDHIAIYAAQGGHLDIVEWASQKGATNFNIMACSAAKSGHLSIVEWAIDKGATEFNWIANHAAFGGFGGIVKWLVAKGANDFNTISVSAARQGHISIVKWLSEKGIIDFNSIATNAAETGHLNAVEWELTISIL